MLFIEYFFSTFVTKNIINMLKFGYYIDNVMDRAWFDSSNVIYGECDESNTQYKTVRLVFKNGLRYQYNDVLVADWVSFKNADSQGRVLNKYFKEPGYKYERLDNVDLDKLNEELENKMGYEFVLCFDTDSQVLTLIENKSGVEKYKMACPDSNVALSIKDMLVSIGHTVKYDEQKQ